MSLFLESSVQIANIISNIFLIFYILIIARIVLSWVISFRGSIPYQLSPIASFIEAVTDPYLNFFRRFIPPLGGLDLSPILAIFTLFILESVIVSLIL